ncbi:MAG: DUF924 domain-containing protein [Alphaproteobacteria bacterium]|nr:DUF924 domain-containing protein [Alphaproteobacteria bacterium]
MSTIEEVLNFWFLPGDEPEFEKSKPNWFSKNDDFDREITERFLGDHEKAADGKLDKWKETSDGCLALLILLDQFSRNMFRGSPKSFEADPKALEIANHAIDKGFDKTFGPHQRMFFYLPFEHHEDIADQEYCLELVKDIPGAMDEGGYLVWAKAHYDIIARFGRFPHRNAVLGRESTSEEIEFLKQEGSSF